MICVLSPRRNGRARSEKGAREQCVNLPQATSVSSAAECIGPVASASECSGLAARASDCSGPAARTIDEKKMAFRLDLDFLKKLHSVDEQRHGGKVRV